MDQATHNKIISFIWGIADDVLHDLFKRGKYPDVILPMCVIRRMDAVLEPTKRKVLDTRKMLDEARITEQGAALCDAAGQAFYNTSKFTLRDLRSRGSQQQLLTDFEDYLNGFSPNVQDILDNFKFRNQMQTLSKADAIGTLINKFLDPDIDLSPTGIDNHSMGTVFEELVRKFNEEIRAALYEEFGDELFTRFASVSGALEKRLAEWGNDGDEGDDENGGSATKGLPEKKRKKLLDPRTWERDARLVDVTTILRAALGDTLFDDQNLFRDRVDAALNKADIKLAATDLKQILKAVSWRVETASPVIVKVHTPGKTKPDPLRGLFAATVDVKPALVEYEHDSDLRDTGKVPLLEEGGIEAFIGREVLPYMPDAGSPRRKRPQSSMRWASSRTCAGSSSPPASGLPRSRIPHTRCSVGTWDDASCMRISRGAGLRMENRFS